uniref:Uncharacterized protein n=1 Tax=Anopheles culicifacies TaxID=139723 RepID=A0A182LVP7_9DIPT
MALSLAPMESTNGALSALFVTSSVGAEDTLPVNTNPVTVTTHIENAAGDKLDFNGDHFFGADKEQHDYNRQAHLKLEYVRNQDPQLRRFLGKSITKRQTDFPYPAAVYPPTHYEPPSTVPPTTTTTTTTTTTPAPTTTTEPPTPGVPHEVYGVPPLAEEPLQVPVPCADCVFSQLPPLPELVYPSVPVPLPAPVEPQPPSVLCNHEPVPLVGTVPSEPSDGSLYNLNELVGVLLDGPPVPSESWSTDSEPPSSGSSGCADCTFEQLPALPELVYPSLPSTTTTTAPPSPPPSLSPIVPEEPTSVPSNCLPAEHRVRVEQGTYDPVDSVDLRLSQSPSKVQPRVLSTHSQVILVQSMAPYPVLRAKPGRTQPKPLNRGALKFKHSRKESHFDLQRSEQDQVWSSGDDSVVVPSAGQQGEVSEIVLCTVDCHTVEEKVKSPLTPAMEIPSDGRLW